MCATSLVVGKRLLSRVDYASTKAWTTVRNHSSARNAEEASPKVRICLNMCVPTFSRPWPCVGRSGTRNTDTGIPKVRIHTGQKPYACDFPGCGKSFTRADQLARHITTHTKENGTRQGKDEKESDSSEYPDWSP